MSRSTLEKYMAAVRRGVREHVERGVRCRCSKTAAACGGLLDREGYLWSFVRVEGVEPTNNDAEQTLRHAVLWRKTSGGTDSEGGSRFVERVLSVVATCRRQGRNVLEFLTACCRAQLNGEAPPSLLPHRRLSHQAA